MTNDSFIRWQDITIGQLTYAVNLILGLSVAALGFSVSLLLGDTFYPSGYAKCWLWASLMSLILAVGLGIYCVINRLCDFRVTMRIARLREKRKLQREIQRLRKLSTLLGKITWRIFLGQIFAFGLGIFLLVVSVYLTSGGELTN